MRFYAYLPTYKDREPHDLQRRMIFTARDVKSARKKILNFWGIRAKLFKYKNYFDRDTFEEIELL